MTVQTIVGIDLGKHHLDVAIDGRTESSMLAGGVLLPEVRGSPEGILDPSR